MHSIKAANTLWRRRVTYHKQVTPVRPHSQRVPLEGIYASTTVSDRCSLEGRPGPDQFGSTAAECDSGLGKLRPSAERCLDLVQGSHRYRAADAEGRALEGSCMQSIKIHGRREPLLDPLGELPFEAPLNFAGCAGPNVFPSVFAASTYARLSVSITAEGKLRWGLTVQHPT